MSLKLATPDLLEIKVFKSKGYDVILFAYDVINKFLPHDSNSIVDVIMWTNFGNFSISMKIWPEKPIFLSLGSVQ